MKNEQQTIFYSAMMTGLFIGIVDTLICLGFNIFYRSYTGYFPAEFINVSSLIFIVNILLLLAGLLYYAFLRLFKKGDGLFLALILLLTAWLTWQTFNIHRFDDARLNHGFDGLLGGIVLILGISSACIPLLYQNKKFLDQVI